jgi:catechol 2,3-dioxygenase-like lactoylglutathione lyase family enzyme
MYDHIGLRVGNLDASVRFYTAALAPLGYVLCSRDDSGAGFGPKGAAALWLHLHNGKAGTGTHVAFRAYGARRLQPDLFCRVPDRPRRQQRRGGLHVTEWRPRSLHRHCEKRSDEAIHSSFAAPWIASLRSQ